MRVFLNAGHSPNGRPDCGAVNHDLDLRESDIAEEITNLLERYLTNAGVEVVGNVQDDSLSKIVGLANASDADLFISIHCNAFNGAAKGTETCIYPGSRVGTELGNCIQSQIVNSLGTVDRGLKERPNLYVLKYTNMPSVLVETAFIDNYDDGSKLRDKPDEFARAIARGVTDYISGGTAPADNADEPARAKYFSAEEMMCHGREQGHCNCGTESANNVSQRLLDLLDKLRENIGGALEVSCMYRCSEHNAAVGGVANSQHVLGTAADVQTPNYDWCNTPEQLKWYAQQLPFDGIGLYDWGVHLDVREGGVGAGIEW
jgi:N-acetylmuramoyl-L-alanine amidase